MEVGSSRTYREQGFLEAPSAFSSLAPDRTESTLYGVCFRDAIAPLHAPLSDGDEAAIFERGQASPVAISQLRVAASVTARPLT